MGPPVHSGFAPGPRIRGQRLCRIRTKFDGQARWPDSPATAEMTAARGEDVVSLPSLSS
jgi:hypothetical protein